MCIRDRPHVITSSFDWFNVLSVSYVIGQSNYFGFGFTTLKRKPLYMFIHDKITFKLISRCGGIRNVCFLSRMLVKMNSAKTMQPVKQVLQTEDTAVYALLDLKESTVRLVS